MIKVAKPIVGEEEIQALAEVLRSERYVSGPRVKDFEEAWADYIGVKHCVAVNSGTAALHTTLLAYGIGSGDEVIIPSLTFFATASAIIMTGATPVFADINMDDYCLSCRDAENKITDRTKAIIPVHLYGHPAEMDGFCEIGKNYGVTLIEDAAQAHGAEYRSQKVGGIGDAGCWSFYATKNLTTGEGGMITTNDEEIAKIAKIIRNHGMTSRDEHAMIGYNYRMNEFAAAMGLVQLGKLDRLNSYRHKISTYMLEVLGRDKPGWLIVPKVKDYVKHAWFWCPVQIDEGILGRSTLKIRAELREKGVETRHRYVEPLYKQPILRNYIHLMDYTKVFCPNAEEIAGKMLGLPNHPEVSEYDADYIIEKLRSL